MIHQSNFFASVVRLLSSVVRRPSSVSGLQPPASSLQPPACLPSPASSLQPPVYLPSSVSRLRSPASSLQPPVYLPSSVLTALVVLGFCASVAQPAQAASLRVQVAQRGDFALIGNTLAHDCAPSTPAPVVGMVGACGINTADSSPDVYWRSDDPAPGQVQANDSIPAANARSTAVLTLPPGATVTHAFLYWAARVAALPGDATATLDRPGGFTASLTALQTAESTDLGNFYQSVTDVTSLVQMHGSGPYRVSGVSSLNLINANQSVAAVGWWMVVFYEDSAATFHNLALFDGLDAVLDLQPSTSLISGFTVPNAGFDAKLGVIAYDGDQLSTGDQLLWDGTALGDAANPSTDFFNGTRSFLGAPVSNVGDLPQLTGTPQSMSGLDLDVIDITAQLSPGQNSATITAQSTSADTYLVGGFITSISTLKPDLSTSTKSALDLNGGGLVPGDIVEYTIVVTNTGDDDAANVVLTDMIPAGVTYVPESIQITQGPNMGGKTDMAGDDQADYTLASDTITVRLGTGADALQGGILAIGESTTVKFQVTVDAGQNGVISNQAVLNASGAQGAPAEDYPTDGNGGSPGAPPTDILVDSDNDGLSDADEIAAGTNPTDADSDDDGVRDGLEPDWNLDSDGDGVINALDVDSDNDGLLDGTELGLSCSGPGTDPTAFVCIPDADGGATTTDPLNPDTDGGGATDGSEDINLDGAVDAGETDPTAGQGADDSQVTDSDGDGLSDGLEATLGTNPNDADSDDDGLLDGQEPNPSVDTDGDGLLNPLDVDSDNDALFDGTELGKDCSHPDTNTMVNHCRPDLDGGATKTSPIDADTDNGGVIDGSEDANLNGVVDLGETNPTSGNAADDALVTDTDGDGLSDALEVFLNSDPNDVDSDNDGWLDGQEANPSDDHDGDGVINLLDEDSDGDALFDGTEVGNDCSNPDTDISLFHCIPDSDAGNTTTNPLDGDTDDGGALDGDEDANHNGVVDIGERDPNNPVDDNVIPECQADSDCGDTMSGKVCDAASQTCVDGCRGMNGNGCPAGEECTSMTDAIGVCVGGAGGAGGGTGGTAPEATVVQGGGCLCATQGQDEQRPIPWGLLVAAAAVAAVRRRRRR